MDGLDEQATEDEMPSATTIAEDDKVSESADSETGILNSSDILENTAPAEKSQAKILPPELVRWFYKADSEKDWTPFEGHDSIKLEYKFRELQLRRTASEISEASPSVNDDEDTVANSVPVLADLFEVHLIKKECYPVYWPRKENTRTVMRGTWFYNESWEPIDEETADKIEAEHLSLLENNERFDTKNKDSKVVHSLELENHHIVWYSEDKIFLDSGSKSSKLARAVGGSFGILTGTSLHRGYQSKAVLDNKPPDITHLVFVIHGIGQKLADGNIVKSCDKIREEVGKMKLKYFPDLDSNNKRVEFLPIEWRSFLVLDGDKVDSITLKKLKGLRHVFNGSALDILYYTSPMYHFEITQGLLKELNRLYNMFCARHPDFEKNGGKVSVFAHSLGSVIFYDILTEWDPVTFYGNFVSKRKDKDTEAGATCPAAVPDHGENKKSVDKRQLSFKVENFFAVGSPLAVFLAIRGEDVRETKCQRFLSPSFCNRFYNLFHPYDPVAYRLEPLVMAHYEKIIPLKIHKNHYRHKPPYESIAPLVFTIKKNKTQEEELTLLKDDLHMIEVKKSWFISLFSRSPDLNFEMDVTDSVEHVNSKVSLEQPSMPIQTEEELASPILTDMGPDTPLKTDDESWVNLDVRVHRLPLGEKYPELEYRLDYQLRKRKLESRIFSAITSHTSYWFSPDVALFLLTQIFPLYGPK